MPADPDVLLDTGPLVALLDARDHWHRLCLEQWNALGDRCVTTEAGLTEATHLVTRGGAGANVSLEFLLAVGLPIVSLERAGHDLAAWLMRRYHDTPTDYADATLVVVAEAIKLRRVFTLDRRGFRTYKRSDEKTFDVVR